MTTGPTLQDGVNIGAALRAIREHRMLTIEQIVEATRVRTGHVEAIEAFDMERLPSRPFTIGYIRAYARALGQDSEAAVDRFKRESPELTDGLPNPVGVRHATGRRPWGVFAAGGFLIIAAVIGWNVIRHVTAQAPGQSDVAVEAPVAEAPPTAQVPVATGPVTLGAPLPAPPEATTPDSYVTPGLPGADGTVAPPPPPATILPMAPPPAGVAFIPDGAVHGSPQGRVVLQARRSASIVVRAPGDVILFARQLGKGEAYRVPAGPGLTIDAVDPTAFQIFVDGASTGMLTLPTTPTARLGAEPTQPRVRTSAARPG